MIQNQISWTELISIQIYTYNLTLLDVPVSIILLTVCQLQCHIIVYTMIGVEVAIQISHEINNYHHPSHKAPV